MSFRVIPGPAGVDRPSDAHGYEENPIPTSKLAPIRVQAADRRAEILAARAEGLTFKAIAARFSLSQRRVREIVSEAFEKLVNSNQELAGKLMETQMRRLDALLEAVWDDAMEGDTKAAGTALAIIDRQCRLGGMDAPPKGGGPIGVLVGGDLELRARQLGIDLEALRGPQPPVALPCPQVPITVEVIRVAEQTGGGQGGHEEGSGGYRQTDPSGE